MQGSLEAAEKKSTYSGPICSGCCSYSIHSNYVQLSSISDFLSGLDTSLYTLHCQLLKILKLSLQCGCELHKQDLNMNLTSVIARKDRPIGYETLVSNCKHCTKIKTCLSIRFCLGYSEQLGGSKTLLTENEL